MALETETTRIHDIVKWEEDARYSREDLLVDESQTLVMGEVCRAGAGGRKVTVATAVNEVQTIGITGTLTAGTFTLTFIDLNGASKETDPIAYNASTAGVQTGIDTALGASICVASGTAITAMVMTFSGIGYAGLPQALIVVDGSDLSGEEDITVTPTTPGGSGVGPANEVQLIAIVGTLTAGSYTLTLPDEDGDLQTITVLYDDDTAAVQAVLDTAFGSDAIVAGGTVHTAQTLTFSGIGFNRRSQPMGILDVSGLTGDTSAAITETTAGGPGGEGKADSICIKALTTASGAKTTKTLFVVRNAIVHRNRLVVTAGAVEQDMIDQLAEAGIIARTN